MHSVSERSLAIHTKYVWIQKLF